MRSSECVERFGRLDVLVNIAGRHQMRRTETMYRRPVGRRPRGQPEGRVLPGRPRYPTYSTTGNIVNVASSPASRVRRTRRLLRGEARAGRAHPRWRSSTPPSGPVNSVCPGGMLTPQIELRGAGRPDFDLIMRTASLRGFMAPLDVATSSRSSHPTRGRRTRRRLPGRQRQGRGLTGLIRVDVSVHSPAVWVRRLVVGRFGLAGVRLVSGSRGSTSSRACFGFGEFGFGGLGSGAALSSGGRRSASGRW